MKTLLLAILTAFPLITVAEIQITSATYGPNCGAPRDNAKEAVAAACNGQKSCTYTVDYHVLGDPAPGCAKTFVAKWTCAAGAQPRRQELPAEAGFGSQLQLACQMGAIAGTIVATPNGTAPPTAGGTVSPPTLEVTATSPLQPISDSSWSVHFRLINNWLTRQPLTGWIDAIAYDASDAAKAHAITGQTFPIAALQADQVAEGDLVFTNTGQIVNGRVDLTYFHISSGYTPGPRSPDGVLPEVPPQVKAQLLQNGNAKALSTAFSDFVVVPSEAQRLAPVFDFDGDSCYPSAAISDQGVPNPGLEEQASGITSGCREPDQLQSARTYYRKATIKRPDAEYSVHMYALYFMKDKTGETSADAGHRHDWEFALVWTTNGAITHATISEHWWVDTRPRSELHFDPGVPEHVKIVYHKNDSLGLTHSMRFGEKDEQAENHLGRWVTPTIVNWYTMTIGGISNYDLQGIFNTHSFGGADCSFNDRNFPERISKEPPPGYPSGADWKAAARNP